MLVTELPSRARPTSTPLPSSRNFGDVTPMVPVPTIPTWALSLTGSRLLFSLGEDDAFDATCTEITQTNTAMIYIKILFKVRIMVAKNKTKREKK